jgi:hypothetical protein
VEHDFDAVERLGHVAGVDQVAFDELDVLHEGREVMAMPGDKAVENANLVSAFYERGNDMRANESGAAGN